MVSINIFFIKIAQTVLTIAQDMHILSRDFSKKEGGLRYKKRFFKGAISSKNIIC